MFKFSKETYQAMKNFESINHVLVFNENKSGYIGTVSEGKGCVGFYDLPSDEIQIPEFRIYDMAQFITLLDDFVKIPDYEVKFYGNHLEMMSESKGSKATYYFATKELIDSQFKVPQKPVKFPDANAVFELTSDQLKQIIKIASIFQHEQLVFNCSSEITVSVTNVQDPTANNWVQKIGENRIKNADKTSVILSIKDMKMDKTKNHMVFVVAGRIAKFVETPEGNLTYYVSPYAISK